MLQSSAMTEEQDDNSNMQEIQSTHSVNNLWDKISSNH